MPVYLREDVEWIAAVDQIFNPMKAHPDDALKGKIEDQWDDAIRFFVLGDLRTCTFKGGRRTHLWVEMTCMIAYFLTPLPALCRLINFEDLSNADVFDLGPKFFHQFVSDTTCIFYPQSSRLTSLKVSHTFVCPGNNQRVNHSCRILLIAQWPMPCERIVLLLSKFGHSDTDRNSIFAVTQTISAKMPRVSHCLLGPRRLLNESSPVSHLFRRINPNSLQVADPQFVIPSSLRNKTDLPLSNSTVSQAQLPLFCTPLTAQDTGSRDGFDRNIQRIQVAVSISCPVT